MPSPETQRREHRRRHRENRDLLRKLGVGLTLVGGTFTAIGVGSFLGAFRGGGSIDYFWCAFVGLPMLSGGVALLRMGYLGAITRYVADEAGDGVRSVARSVAAGLRESAGGARRCGACDHPNDADARFCDQCGARVDGVSAADR